MSGNERLSHAEKTRATEVSDKEDAEEAFERDLEWKQEKELAEGVLPSYRPMLPPLPYLAEHLIKPDHVIEYDLSTVFSLDEIEQHGRDGSGDRKEENELRCLLYALPGEDVARFWEVLQREVAGLDEGEMLLVRLDRVRIMADAAESFAWHFFYEDRPGGRFTAEKQVVLVNPDEGTKRALHLLLKDANDCCSVLMTPNKDAPETWELSYIGKVQANLRGVLTHIHSQGSKGATSQDICQRVKLPPKDTDKDKNLTPEAAQKKLAMTPGDAQRRLIALFKDGLIQREDTTISSAGRPAFLYTFVHPSQKYIPGLSTESLPYSFYNPSQVERAKQYLAAAAKVYHDNYETARKYVEEALKTYEEIEDRKGVAETLWFLGNIARRTEKFEEALNYHQESFRIRQEIHDNEGIAASLHSLGLVYGEWGTNHPGVLSYGTTALDYYTQSMEWRRQHQCDPPESYATLNNVSKLLAVLGRHQEAQAYSIRSLELRVAAGKFLAVAEALLSAAFAAEFAGLWERAVTLSVAGKKVLEEIGKDPNPHDRKLYAARMRQAQMKLPQVIFNEAYKAGKNMSREQATTYAINLH